MGLTSWKGAPDSKIHKYDVVIAKNYLSETEFEKYRIVQDKIYVSDFDELLLKSKNIKDEK